MWRYVTISLIQIMQVQRNSNENQVKNTSTIGLIIEQLEKQIVCNSVQTTDFGTNITEFGIKIQHLYRDFLLQPRTGGTKS